MSEIDIDAILNLLGGRPKRSFSLKDIQAAMDLSAPERKQVSKVLKNLAKQGTIVQSKGGRFALPGKLNLVEGRLSLHRDGYGFVSPSSPLKKDIFIPARYISPAMHGDFVLVKVERSIHSDRPEGRVISVKERAYKEVIGRYVVERGSPMLLPVDPHLKEVFQVSGNDIEVKLVNQVVLAEIEQYPNRSRAAVCRIKDVLGKINDPKVEIKISALKFNLPHEFSMETIEETKRLPDRVSEDDSVGREDLRSLNFFTIDGETAMDFDDAVAIEKRKGGFRLYVAIADVAHYVKVGTAIDNEALLRGTSVYFPGNCIPMLPEKLSHEMCSLRPNADRLVLTVSLDFDGQGQRQNFRFFEAVIRSRERMTYTHVASVINGGSQAYDSESLPYSHDLKVMLELAKLRKNIRDQRGSLDFDLPEAEIVLDLQGKPEGIVRSERNWAHQIIEEFMLAANEAAAFWLSTKRRPNIYRVHEAPSPETMHQFQEFIANFNQGITLSEEPVQPKTLQTLLNRVVGLPEEAVINHVLLRSLPQAYYSVENLGHFGLATDYYCHFTSPIRRYPDLVVHRIIKQELIKSEHEKLGITSLDTIAQECSVAERRAMEAERDIINLKKCQYMSTKIGETYHGMVTSVRPFGCFVELRDVFVEGLIHITSLENDYYHYEDDRQRLIGASRRQEFTIGTHVVIRVQKVDIERREIDFRLVEESDTNTSRKKAKRYYKKSPL